MTSEDKNWWGAASAALATGAMALAIPYVASQAFGNEFNNPSISLPILALFSLAVLTAGTAGLVLLFGALRLTDGRQALALPQGSVRALIAFSLIVIFIITSVFLFTHLGSVRKTDPIELSKEQADLIPADQLFKKVKITGESATPADATPADATPAVDETPTGQTTSDGNAEPDSDAGPDMYEVILRLKTDDVAEDFAKQILTTISTLVVAMVGFYFGSRSVAQAQVGLGQPKLRILSPDPDKPAEMSKIKAQAGPLRVEVKVSPPGAAVSWARHPPGDPGGEVTQVEPGIFEYVRGDDPAKIEDDVALRFHLTEYADVSATLHVKAE